MDKVLGNEVTKGGDFEGLCPADCSRGWDGRVKRSAGFAPDNCARGEGEKAQISKRFKVDKRKGARSGGPLSKKECSKNRPVRRSTYTFCTLDKNRGGKRRGRKKKKIPTWRS